MKLGTSGFRMSGISEIDREEVRSAVLRGSRMIELHERRMGDVRFAQFPLPPFRPNRGVIFIVPCQGPYARLGASSRLLRYGANDVAGIQGDAVAQGPGPP